jgi:two-component system, NarL family, invasion response regulator UvrY
VPANQPNATEPPLPSARLKQLLLVDDHIIVREGIKRVLEPITDEWCVTEVSNGHHALEKLRQQDFKLAIVDLSMPGMSGLELVKRIKAEHPDTAVLVLSMHAEEHYAVRAFKAGANGYLTKDSAPTELITAVHKAATGGAYVSQSMAERVVQQLNGAHAAPRHAELSDRELEVLQRIVDGERLTDIAEALHLSVKTVSSHKSRIQEKLQLPNMAAVIRYGLEHHLGQKDQATNGTDETPRGPDRRAPREPQ